MVDIRRHGGVDDDLVVDILIRRPTAGPAPTCAGPLPDRAGSHPSADPTAVAHVIDWQPADLVAEVHPDPALVAVLGNAGPAGTARAGSSASDTRRRVGDAATLVYVPGPDTESDVDAPPGLVCEVGDIVSQLVQRDPRNPATLWIPRPAASTKPVPRSPSARVVYGRWLASSAPSSPRWGAGGPRLTTTSPTARRRCPRAAYADEVGDAAARRLLLKSGLALFLATPSGRPALPSRRASLITGGLAIWAC